MWSLLNRYIAEQVTQLIRLRQASVFVPCSTGSCSYSWQLLPGNWCTLEFLHSCSLLQKTGFLDIMQKEFDLTYHM